MPEYEYSITELKHLYMEVNPDASESKARREAQKEHKRRNPNPFHILGLRDMRDPTPRDAIRNITANDQAAARRLGIA